MKKNLTKLMTLLLLTSVVGTSVAFANIESSDSISGAMAISEDIIHTDNAINFDDIMLISNDPWNSNVHTELAVEDTMNSPVPIKARTIANFADYAMEFGYGKIQNHWAEGQIAVLYSHEGVAGIEVDGVLEFQPDRSITTTELASLILNNGNVELDMSLNWQERTLTVAREYNMITDEMLAKANEPILREEMAYMLIEGGKSLGMIVGEPIPYDGVIADLDEALEEFQQSIEEAYVLGLLAGAGDGYRPKNPTTRAETCAIINRLFSYTDRVSNTVENSEENSVDPLIDYGVSTPNEEAEENPVAPLDDEVYSTATPNELSESKPVASLSKDFSIMTGLFLADENFKSFVILTGDNFDNIVIIDDNSNYGDLFDSLNNYDLIEVTHGVVFETSPAKTFIYDCNVLDNSEDFDISKNIILELEKLGNFLVD